MNIEELTLKDTITALFPSGTVATATSGYDQHIGKPVFIRTVTMNFTGRLVAVHTGELVIDGAAWIADSGRFSAALATGTMNEVEPYPEGPVVVSRAALIDVSAWNHTLPSAVK